MRERVRGEGGRLGRVIKVMPGYFLSFETFVLFAQAPDEGN